MENLMMIGFHALETGVDEMVFEDDIGRYITVRGTFVIGRPIFHYDGKNISAYIKHSGGIAGPIILDSLCWYRTDTKKAYSPINLEILKQSKFSDKYVVNLNDED